MPRGEAAVQQRFAGGLRTGKSNPAREEHSRVFAARSQPYYLDLTNPDANKGFVVLRLSEMLNIPAAQIATIGDMPNDISMFQKSGLSIAMGQAADEVKRAARYSTSSSEDEGFANAVERYILSS